MDRQKLKKTEIIMPELPEVETITSRIRPYITGKKITDIDIFQPKSFFGKKEKVVGVVIHTVDRRAKMIRIRLENQQNILIHLKMTGQLIYTDDKHRVGGGHPTQDWITLLPSKHTRVQLSFEDGSKLFFNDQRVFGWLKVMNNTQVELEWQKYAMDVTSKEFTIEYFSQQVRKRKVLIKKLILDNAVVSGIGNIYACDALNLAQISPFREANTLSDVEIERLYNACKLVIQKGIDLGGATTDGKYIDVHGFAGRYQLESRVYARKGQDCLHCGHTIDKKKLTGRGTYFCPNCQK